MGYNDHITTIGEEAETVALKAGAITRCEFHDEITIDNFDADAMVKAYAIGTERWKQGDLECAREEFMEAIKNVVQSSADECPICARLMDD